MCILEETLDFVWKKCNSCQEEYDVPEEQENCLFCGDDLEEM